VNSWRSPCGFLVIDDYLTWSWRCAGILGRAQRAPACGPRRTARSGPTRSRYRGRPSWPCATCSRRRDGLNTAWPRSRFAEPRRSSATRRGGQRHADLLAGFSLRAEGAAGKGAGRVVVNRRVVRGIGRGDPSPARTGPVPRAAAMRPPLLDQAVKQPGPPRWVSGRSWPRSTSASNRQRHMCTRGRWTAFHPRRTARNGRRGRAIFPAGHAEGGETNPRRRG